GVNRGRAVRHQTRPRLLDGFAARPDDGVARCRRRCGGHHSFASAWVFLSGSISLRRVPGFLTSSRTVRLQNWVASWPGARDLCSLRGRHDGAERCAVLFFRWLDQGRNSARSIKMATIAFALLLGAARRDSDRALYDASDHLRFLRQLARWVGSRA